MTPILVDARNVQEVLPQIIEAVSKADFTGIDTETQDSNRHNGLNILCRYDPETGKKPQNSKLVFDINRTIMCGVSLYPDGHDYTYYFNLGHADVENRIPWEVVRIILNSKKEGAYWVAHNAPFEIVHFKTCWDYDLRDVICSMQLAVSAYGDDEYPIHKWVSQGLGEMKKLLKDLRLASAGHVPGETMSPALSDIIGKITAKESDANHSYNGFCKDISYGHGLKAAVKSFFGVEMSTFKETLGDNAHMGQLTGDEVVSYGCDDAYWCIRLFHELLGFMAHHCPNAITTFFEQENPMIYLYADMWRVGMRVNAEAVLKRRAEERVNFAKLVRRMKGLLAQLDYSEKPLDEKLKKYDHKWYTEKSRARYMQMISEFCALPDSSDDYTQSCQLRSAVSNAWAEERGDDKIKAVNLTHYMPMRVIMYDLLGLKLMVSKGKVQSDAEHRAKAADSAEDPLAKEIMTTFTEMASLETRMKLYLNPYVHLMDPETGRLHPTINSMLNTRRMAASNPNPMQLAKRGGSTYVRGFFLGDDPDHLVVSLDWSAIELVIVGELSRDPEFFKVYGQIPHGDLHAGSAADILKVDVPEMTEPAFKDLKLFEDAREFAEKYGFGPETSSFRRLFTNLKGEPLTPPKANKYWRTEVGKGANFNYWYSGWLATIGERMGWGADKTKLATENYASRFAIAEEWRRSVINGGKLHGFVELLDGHRRYRREGQGDWPSLWDQKWGAYENDGYRAAVQEMGRRIHRRAGNQLVNAAVQGLCATIAKRSALRIMEAVKQRGWPARLMCPIHDELVFSVHKDYVVRFIEMAYAIMVDHPDLFPTLKLDASPAVGTTFEPWDLEKAPLGQIELFEPPAEIVGEVLAFKRLEFNQMQVAIDWLIDAQRQKLAA